MVLQENVDILSHIMTSLELGADEPAQRDLLIEWAHQKKEEPLSDFLISLGTALGHYFKQITLSSSSQLIQATHQYVLLLPQNNDICFLVKRDKKGVLWQEQWEGTQYTKKRANPRSIQRLIGPKPQEWLALEHSTLGKQVPKMKPVKRLMSFLEFESKQLVLIVSYALAMGVLGLGVPIASQSLVNNVAFGALRQPLVVLCLILFLTLGFLTLLRSLQLILIEMLQRRIFVRVTQDTAERLLRIKSMAFDQSRLTELVNRFFDVVTVQKSASFLLLDGLGILLATLTGMALLAFYHPLLFVFDLFLLAAILFVIIVMSKGGQKTSIKESGKKYEIAAWLEELALHPQLFKPANGSQYAVWKTETMLQGYLGARENHFKVVLRQNIGAFSLQAVAATSLLALGGWLVIEGQLTIGQLVAAELVVANVVNSFSKVGKHLETWYDLMAAFDKLGYLFDLPQEPIKPNLLNAKREPMAVCFEKVTYQHPQENKSLRVDFKLMPGERVALLGNNAWETHVLLDIFYGSRLPTQGLVLADKQPLHQLLLSDYRSRAVVVRGIEMIEASILDNLRIGNPQLSRQEATELLVKVGLWSRVQHFKDVLDTQLGYNGFPLSPSESHRFMVARALGMSPQLLILNGTLDHMGWNVDGPVSRLLFEETFRKEMSLLITTNQVSILSYFDRIYNFNHEGILESSSLENVKQGLLYKEER